VRCGLESVIKLTDSCIDEVARQNHASGIVSQHHWRCSSRLRDRLRLDMRESKSKRRCRPKDRPLAFTGKLQNVHPYCRMRQSSRDVAYLNVVGLEMEFETVFSPWTMMLSSSSG
jgi:hypothetical protein